MVVGRVAAPITKKNWNEVSRRARTSEDGSPPELRPASKRTKGSPTPTRRGNATRAVTMLRRRMVTARSLPAIVNTSLCITPGLPGW